MTSRSVFSRHLIACITMLAIMFGAFSPALGHAIARASGLDGQYVAVCTSTGIQYVKLDLSDPETQSPSSNPHQIQSECAWCFTAAHMPGLPVSDHKLDFFLPHASYGHDVDLNAPGTRLVWSSSLARAPPHSFT